MHPVRLLSASVLVALLAVPAAAQTFSSGSDGSDGPLTLPANAGEILFQNDFDDMINDGIPDNGRQLDVDGDYVYHFTTITIPVGTTLKLSARVFGEGRPVVFLASANVTIEGTIEASGEDSPDQSPVGGFGGAGGYSGGWGGQGPLGIVPPTPGNGPGGGRAGVLSQGRGENASHVDGGTAYGHPLLHPLIGGSGGGGGGVPGFQAGGGGGGGGGAFLLACSTTVSLRDFGNGRIQANSGNPSRFVNSTGGMGSGGAIRVVATTIAGNGALQAVGGRVRVEAYRFTGNLSLSASSVTRGAPNALFPGTTSAAIRVVSIAGSPVTARPTGSFFTPDAVIVQPGPVQVVLATRNVPAGTVLQLTFQPEVGAQYAASSTPVTVAADGTGSATAMTQFPAGPTRIFVTGSWTP
jgi:hypothetical protein